MVVGCKGYSYSHKECPSRSHVEEHSCKKNVPFRYYYHKNFEARTITIALMDNTVKLCYPNTSKNISKVYH